MKKNFWLSLVAIQPEPDAAWLESALNAMSHPKDLMERNWQQLMLADRYATQFQMTRTEALSRLAGRYSNKFPH